MLTKKTNTYIFSRTVHGSWPDPKKNVGRFESGQELIQIVRNLTVRVGSGWDGKLSNLTGQREIPDPARLARTDPPGP